MLGGEVVRERNTCCYIGGFLHRYCQRPAEWLICHGSAPDDYTFACSRHVGQMLTDAPCQYVYHLTPDVEQAIKDPENQPNQFGVKA